MPALSSAVANLLGVVVAGGASSRFGVDKATHQLAGETLAARAARRLSAVCNGVVVADAHRGVLGDAFESLPDGPGRGPAAGILGAAAAHPGRTLLVLACDLPLVPIELLAEIAASSPDFDLVLPRWELGFEPLCARYGPAALQEIEHGALREDFSLVRLAQDSDLSIRFFESAEIERYGDPAQMFTNVNELKVLNTITELSLP